MDYIVFDLEWNQCPDGKQQEKQDLPFEIIEIGAVKLNMEKEETGRFHEYIRPAAYRRLHYKTREILHVSNEDLLAADDFPAVFERFFQWCGKEALFCTWGSLDLLELQRNVRYHQLPSPFPFPLKYLDIQKIFSLSCEDGKSRRTLEYAIDFLGIPKDDAFHSAFADARYTARIAQHFTDEELLPFYSVDYFRTPKKRSEELSLLFPGYAKYVSRTFASKSEIMRDRMILSTKCYLCRKPASRKIPWFPVGTRNYLCLSYCKEHGYLKGKLRLKKAEDRSGYFCVKTLKLISEADALDIARRYHARQEKKSKGI